jgi:hypothetical protein
MVKRAGSSAVLLVLAAACGPSASNDASERSSHACLPGLCLEASAPPTTGDAGFVNEPLEPWPDESAGPLSGVYSMLGVVNATVASIPVSLQLLFRLRILQTFNTTTVKQSNTLCALKLPSVKGVATLTIGPLLQGIIQQESDIVSEGTFLSTEGTTQKYNPPPFLVVLGAKLKHPTTDPLPTMMNLTGEWDEDHDGHPGVTVGASVFTCTTTQELYVAIRTMGTLSGTFKRTDAIDGTMAVTESESVLGYSNSCLSAAAGIDPMLSPTTPFHAQRLADETELDTTGNVSCSDIVAKAPALYGSVWTGVDGGAP